MRIWKKHADIYEIIKRVDDFLRESLIANQQVLNDAINDLLNAGGKRLRPAMVLLAGRFGRYDENKLIPLSAAIEIMHMATLVHDDVIDESDLRRGRPTTRSRWGNQVAVLTGDFCLPRHFHLSPRMFHRKICTVFPVSSNPFVKGRDQFQSGIQPMFP